MALGDNTAFFNETTFLLGATTVDNGISGLDITAIGGGAIDSPAAKVLFTAKETLLGETGPHLGNIKDVARGLQFEFSFFSRYINEEISIITADREAIQVTLHEDLSAASIGSSQTFQLTAKGPNSVGPTLRRLNHLGYV